MLLIASATVKFLISELSIKTIAHFVVSVVTFNDGVSIISSKLNRMAALGVSCVQTRRARVVPGPFIQLSNKVTSVSSGRGNCYNPETLDVEVAWI